MLIGLLKGEILTSPPVIIGTGCKWFFISKAAASYPLPPVILLCRSCWLLVSTSSVSPFLTLSIVILWCFSLSGASTCEIVLMALSF